MIPQSELVNAIRHYKPQVDEDLVNRAYDYAKAKHSHQKRASGEPYVSHPIEVAYKLTRYKLDESSIITALLHDTVEDTDATLDEIEKLFGSEIRTLVDGVTKLNRLEIKSESSKQAENFRKLLLAMSEDLRVLLVKLADRLHNMETLHHITKPEKRARIARETLDIYANLAERIGMRRLKEELQDLSFQELYPEARESIVKRLEFLRKKGRTKVLKAQDNITQLMKEAGIEQVEVIGREKKPFSIWKKMEEKNIAFEELSDIIAFRVLTHSVADCYAALGVIHAKYHTIPGRFKDYISTPKNNGYQSIHTSVIGPNRQRMEVQIRTRDMHEIAEYGVAAHWSYKQGAPINTDGKQFRWIRELLEILEHSEGAEEFLEHTKLEMYHDQVFCFTPKGDIIALPRGSTPVDFAFTVHSQVGFNCVGSKVNGRIVPLKHQLKNGDQVEIITAKTQTPSPTWERFVVTGKARSEIRKFIRTQQRNEYITLGRAILAKTFKQEGHDLKDKMLEPALGVFQKKEADDLYAEVGEGLLNRNQVYDAVFHTRKSEAAGLKNPFTLAKLNKKTAKPKEFAMPIKGLIPGMALHFAGCCHPIPGDRIVGIVTTGKGITVHTMDCATLENFSDSPERWIDIAWDQQGQDEHHVGRIRANVSHETAALASIANVIAKEMGNISNLKITNRSPDFFELIIDIEVQNSRHLNLIIAALRSKDVVQSVDRV
ncbi:MAG: bifunctional (p)ppGpp synthetase/guanosine-3',5'-bis(diphosphate) 3'-pyrophosphohydrolase [Rickettsiales bacterium]|nr:bifunctional (p)ppGpp synthetase/guanosine-3',5'-bis(diphosphate) 3'-pyrophosphohydrolase [Rickettsiales bacterium]|tara:strand:+ start:285 stop:2432 length:2148 start_codon:yes stop_codon:yes gene_type:complete